MIGHLRRWTRFGREAAVAGLVSGGADPESLRAAYEGAMGDPELRCSAEVIGTDEAFERFCRGARRGLGVDLRRRPDLWTHELVPLTTRLPPSLRDRFARVPGERWEDRLRVLIEAWEGREEP